MVLFLNEDKKELAKRYFLLGESYSEIARGLGITTAAVHKKAMSTIKKLRKELNK